MNLVKPEVRDAWDILHTALDTSETRFSDTEWIIEKIADYRRDITDERAYLLVKDLGYARAADRLGISKEYAFALVRRYCERTGAPKISTIRKYNRHVDTAWDISHLLVPEQG